VSLEISYTSDEMMTVSAARMLSNGAICSVGIGLPLTAANLACLLHAPDVVLIYESGPIGAKPAVLPLSIGDGSLAEQADAVVSTPEIFRYWLQGGRVDIGFLGAAQIDRYVTINTTVIGNYHRPTVRLPGAGGAPEISTSAREVLIIVRQSRKSFVEKLDFVTSTGFLTGGNSRRQASISGGGPSAVITDLCALRPEPDSHEFIVASVHQGVSPEQIRQNTGWKIRFEADCGETIPPTPHELRVLRDLKARTSAAQGMPEPVA
jgi:glutaconate CoA-transferase, subunit B